MPSYELEKHTWVLCSSHTSAAFRPCLWQEVQAQGLSESTFQFHHLVPSGRSEPWPTQLQESIPWLEGPALALPQRQEASGGRCECL